MRKPLQWTLFISNCFANSFNSTRSVFVQCQNACQSAANVNTFPVWRDIDQWLNYGGVVSVNNRWPFPNFFQSRTICENNSNKQCAIRYFSALTASKSYKFNIKTEEPLKNLKTSSGSFPFQPPNGPKYLVRQSL
jgi:hypothetical protein